MNFAVAFAIGFSVASIPGPILILILTETLRKGVKGGLSATAAPVVLDAAVMIPLGVWLQASLFRGKGVILLGVIGAAFLFWLGLRSLKSASEKTIGRASQSPPAAGDSPDLASFWKAALAHLTSPYPYLYWGTVGATFIRRGLDSGGLWSATIFPLGFWIGASAFSLLLIYFTSSSRRFLPPAWEPHIHRAAGMSLIGCAIILAFKTWGGAP